MVSIRHSRIRVLSVILSAGLLAGLGLWSEVTTWDRLVDSANNRLMETSRAVALHTDDVFALAEQPLAHLVPTAQAVIRDKLSENLLFGEMKSLQQSSIFVEGLTFIGTNGRAIYSTSPAITVGEDLSSRAYFSAHRLNGSEGVDFGTLIRSPTNNEWLLPVSRRVNAADGSFAGVMLATIDMDHFIRFIESFEPNGESAFYLMRNDGAILLRYPFRSHFEAGLGDRKIFLEQSRINQHGNHEYASPLNERPRLSGYYRSARTEITAIATRSKTALFHNWVMRSKYPWICLIAAYLAGLAITFRWLHQIRLREIGEQKVAAREAEFRLIANASPDVIEKLSMAGVREYVSPAAAKLFEQAPEDLLGTNVTDAKDEATATAWKAALFRLQAGQNGETILLQRQRRDGSVMWLESVLSCVRAESGAPADGIVVTTRDVTRQELAKRELDALAVTDELTGLFNKRYFSQHLNSFMADHPGTPLSLLLLDLDRFKQFNDTYGHLPGDHCLRDVASAIRSALPDNGAIAARFGGEEMAVLLPGYSRAASLLIAEKIRRAVEAMQIPHVANLPGGVVTVSIGVGTLRRGHSETADTLIVSADEALYEAKRGGRNRVATRAVPAPSLKHSAAV